MGSSTALISLVIATTAVALSLITLIFQRRQKQREAYRGLYEVLMSEQLQRGRWLIEDISKTQHVPEDSSPDLYLIYRTLGWFDTLAMFDQRRLVPRRWVLDVWHHHLRDMKTAATVMRNDRLARGQEWAPWPHLWSLLNEAVQYKSDMPCCWLEMMAYSQLQAPGEVRGGDEWNSGSAKIQRARSMLVKPLHEFRSRRSE
jgi:hypothetical protein